LKYAIARFTSIVGIDPSTTIDVDDVLSLNWTYQNVPDSTAVVLELWQNVSSVNGTFQETFIDTLNTSTAFAATAQHFTINRNYPTGTMYFIRIRAESEFDLTWIESADSNIFDIHGCM